MELHDSALTEESSRDRMAKACQSLAPYPGGYTGRGIVVAGGGNRYFACAWVCIRMLRALGCTLPVELWHLGRREMTDEMRNSSNRLAFDVLTPLRFESVGLYEFSTGGS